VTIGPETSEISGRKKIKRVETSAVKYNGLRPASFVKVLYKFIEKMDNLPTMSESSTFLRHVSKLKSAGVVVEQHLLAVVTTVLSGFINQHTTMCQRIYVNISVLSSSTHPRFTVTAQ